jgi:hypothetical protein
MGFEPTIPAFEREKTFHALDGSATVIGPTIYWSKKMNYTDVDLVPAAYRSVCGHWCWRDAHWKARRSSSQNRAYALRLRRVRWNGAHVGPGLHGPGRSWSCDSRGTRTHTQVAPCSSSVYTWAAASCRTWRIYPVRLQSLLSLLKQYTALKAKHFTRNIHIYAERLGNNSRIIFLP